MKNFSFSRDEKLKKYSQIKPVLTNGRKYCGTFAHLYVRTNSASITRLGIVVLTSKSFRGRAVQRNKVKRLVREFYRLNKCSMVKGVDIVFKVFLSSVAYRHDDVKTNAFNLCEKAGILKI